MNDSERIILEKIKNLRNQKGISQTKLAEAIGISQTGYAKIERGDTENIPLSVAVGIAKALNVGFNELFNIDGDSRKIDGLNGQIEELNDKIAEKDKMIKLQDQVNQNLKFAIVEVSNIAVFFSFSDIRNKIDNEKYHNIVLEIINSYANNYINEIIEWGYIDKKEVEAIKEKRWARNWEMLNSKIEIIKPE